MTRNTKHNWYWEEDGANPYIVDSKTHHRVADVFRLPGTTHKATVQSAKLMAKAPEMEELLKECLHAFNVIPNKRVGPITTYELASKIEELLKE